MTDPSSPRKTVLVVDDEPSILKMLEAALRAHGLDSRLAAGGLEAVDIYRRHGDSIDVVLLDVLMPGAWDGPHTLAALQSLNPGVRCCFMSGYTGPYVRERLLGLGAAHVFDKPFPSLAELARVLADAAEGR